MALGNPNVSCNNPGTVKVKIDEPWSFTRPDSSALGMFFFQCCDPVYCQAHIIQHKCTYLDCIAHDFTAVLDNKAEVRVLAGEHQRLRANAASNIDNQ
jgi:hypothetical protein